MTKFKHTIFIFTLFIIVISAFAVLLFYGSSYYGTGIGERVYHDDHGMLKPSGTVGHGVGIAGSLAMIIGMASYMARKRFRFMSRLGLLKHWLEFHIFLCTLGPLLVLFHTAFKIGGLVAVSFWSMVAVFLSGIIGRFIYLQIPRSIEGRELSLNEARALRNDTAGNLKNFHSIDDDSYSLIINAVKRKTGAYHKNMLTGLIASMRNNRESLRSVRKLLKSKNLPKKDFRNILTLVRNEINLNRKIEQLDLMQSMFKYWHVAHLPFAMVMIIIMLIHVAVTIIFGYRWIF